MRSRFASLALPISRAALFGVASWWGVFGSAVAQEDGGAIEDLPPELRELYDQFLEEESGKAAPRPAPSPAPVEAPDLPVRRAIVVAKPEIGPEAVAPASPNGERVVGRVSINGTPNNPRTNGTGGTVPIRRPQVVSPNPSSAASPLPVWTPPDLAKSNKVGSGAETLPPEMMDLYKDYLSTLLPEDRAAMPKFEVGEAIDVGFPGDDGETELPAGVEEALANAKEVETSYPDILGGSGAGAVPTNQNKLWMTNPFEARRKAMREGKYLLLGFLSSSSATSRMLSKEVFTTQEFLDLLDKHFVACYIDFGAKGSYSGQVDDSQIKAQEVRDRFRDAYNVRGFPAIAVFDHTGKHVDTLTGYRTKRPRTWMQALRHTVEADIQDRLVRRNKLAEKGFQSWRNKEGMEMFARLLGTQDGNAYFLDEGGRRRVVPVDILTEDDQAKANARRRL